MDTPSPYMLERRVARALLVAEDPLVREGFAARLLGTIAGEATTTDDLGAAVMRCEANVVLWDLGPSGGDDAEITAFVGASRVPVVALAPPGASIGNDLVGAGVAGVISRDATTAALESTLVTVLHGLCVVDRALLPEPATAITDPDGGASILAEAADNLTAREHEVIALMAEGLSNKQIADRLGISAHTAKFHVNAVLGKLGASTRTEAVVRALQRGVVLL